MPKWSEYTKKNQPSDNDIMMIEDKDANVNKLLTFSGLSEWIIEKLKKNNVISGALKFKGSSAYASLPTNPDQNDYYYSPDGNGTDGAGYYAWNGTAWIFIGNNDKGVDSTFTVEGAAADAKAVGDKFAKVDSETASLKEDMANKFDLVDNENGFLKRTTDFFTWEKGAYDGAGNETTSTMRYRSTDWFEFGEDAVVINTDASGTVGLNLIWKNEDNTINQWGWKYGGFVVNLPFVENRKYKVVSMYKGEEVPIEYTTVYQNIRFYKVKDAVNTYNEICNFNKTLKQLLLKNLSSNVDYLSYDYVYGGSKLLSITSGKNRVRYEATSDITSADAISKNFGYVIGDLSDYVGKTLCLSLKINKTSDAFRFGIALYNSNTKKDTILASTATNNFISAEIPDNNDYDKVMIRLWAKYSQFTMMAGQYVEYSDIQLEVGKIPSMYNENGYSTLTPETKQYITDSIDSAIGVSSDVLDIDYESINRTMAGKVNFAIQTDTHMNCYNNYRTDGVVFKSSDFSLFGKVVKTIQKIGCDATMNLGDIVRGYEFDSDYEARKSLDKIVNVYSENIEKMLYVIGNHDDGNLFYYDTSYNDKKDVSNVLYPYEQFQRIAKNGVNGKNNKNYYYADIKGIRFITLYQRDFNYSEKIPTIEEFRISQTQIEWFKNDALNTTNPIIVLTHAPLVSELFTTGGTGFAEILTALQTFKANGGIIIAVLNGHTHKQDQAVVDGINHIVFANGYSFFEIMSVDLSTKTIKCKPINNLTLQERTFSY